MSELVEKIESEDSYRLKYYEYGEAFHGSFKGMRYKLARNPQEVVWFCSQEDKEKGQLEATIWPEPFSFENTSDDKKTSKQFPFTEDGKNEMVDWLNTMYEERKEEWEAVAGKIL